MLKQASPDPINESLLEQANRNPSIASQHASSHFRYQSKDEYDRFHKRVKVFLANRSQNDYQKLHEDFEERAKRFDYDFRPKNSPNKQNAAVIVEEDEEKKMQDGGINGN
jgi:hypothetical protein